MKKKILIALLTPLLTIHFLHAQIEWLNPKPSGYSNQSAFFINSQKALMLNSNGDLLETNNQGLTWEVARNFPAATQMDIKDSIAVIIGYNTLNYSSNYGKSWQTSNTPASVNWIDVVSKDTFFLASTNGKIYRTDDAGKTWKTFSSNKTLSSIEFVNSKIGYLGCTNYSILKTEDGGTSWQSVVNVNTIPSNTKTIKFFDANIGFAFREHSSLLSTKDGGKTWSTYDISDDIYSITFIDQLNVIACGEYGTIYKTKDGGVTWQYIGPNSRIWLYDLYTAAFINQDTGFAAGARGRILKTVDGGTTWSQYSPTYIQVNGITKKMENTAYAIVGNQIYKTIDYGNSWNPLSLIVGVNYAEYDIFQQIHFFNKDTGVVTASEYGRMYKTYDGGATWTIISSSSQGYQGSSDLQFLPDNKTGYLTYYSSYSSSNIMKTTDAGDTWSEIWRSQYQGETFNQLYFTSEKNAFASRYNRLYQSTDSAKTWNLLWQLETITDIQFVNEKVGFVTGENGMLFKSIDSGKKWTKIPITPTFYDDIYCIKFANEKIGFIGTEGGKIYRSIDSGTTWQQYGKVNFDRINTIMINNDTTVYFTGENGAILQSKMSELILGQPTVGRTDCNSEVSISVNALLGKAEMLQIEYGVSDFNNVIIPTSSIVNNQAEIVKGSIKDLPPSTTYKVRLKSDFEGKTYYSKETYFRTPDKPITPTITSSTSRFSYCEGDSIILQTNAASGNQWFLNGSPIAEGHSQQLTAIEPGVYQLIRTQFCYQSDTASVTVTATPLPPKPTITTNGDLLFSSANNGNQWYYNDSIMPGEINAQLKPIKNGYYSVKVTNNSCVSSFSDKFDFIIPGKDFIVYPNPSSRQITVRTTHGEKMLVQMFDLFGNLVFTETSASNSLTIDISSLSVGKYNVKVTLLSQNKTSSQVIIKN
nr:YCF48-related protein [uncultured Lacibacter sp.]